MKNTYITDVIGNQYKEWKQGDLILIEAGTGNGKSHFIKNTLMDYCRKNDKTILFLTNRNNLKGQVKHDIGKTDIVDVINYQKLECQEIRDYEKISDIDINAYDYIVCDEAHYFFTDAAFNRRTDLPLNVMLNNKNTCKILMTATPVTLRYYLSNRHGLNDGKITPDYIYQLQNDYSYLETITAFKNHSSIDTIIESIPEDEQIMLFSSAKRAYEIAKKHKGAFICSQHNKDGYFEHANKDEIENIITKSDFDSRLLCTTTVLDCGINIKQHSKVKHIIIDIFDRDTFIQCLGRRRIAKGENIHLYFFCPDNKTVNGYLKKHNNAIVRADLLLEHGLAEYVKMKFKDDKFTDTRIIDEYMVNDGVQKQVNACMYTKLYTDILIMNLILEKKSMFNQHNYISLIARTLKVKSRKIVVLEAEQKKSALEEYLESIVGRKLFKEEQKELIDRVDVRVDRKQKKSIKHLNEGLKMNNLPYVILPKKSDSKRYWIVEKIDI